MMMMIMMMHLFTPDMLLEKVEWISLSVGSNWISYPLFLD